MRRDKNCDIVVPRREVSRQHARLAVDKAGSVWLSSLGKEPVCVNGQPADEAVELYNGDQIEVRYTTAQPVGLSMALWRKENVRKDGPAPEFSACALTGIHMVSYIRRWVWATASFWTAMRWLHQYMGKA